MDKHKTVMVCVTQQKTCEELIRKASARCGSDGSLHILHVSRDNWNFFENIKEGEALEYLFIIAKSVGAELTILHSKDIAGTIAQFAHHYQVGSIYLGCSAGNTSASAGKDVADCADGGLKERLRELLSDSDIQVEVIAT